MKETEVIEYKLDAENRIIGWTLHKISNRPELAEVPMPTEEMRKPGALFDEFGNGRWIFEDGNIVEVVAGPTDSQIALKEFTAAHLYRGFKALVEEIDALRVIAGGAPTAKYTRLKSILDRIQNGEE